MDLEIVTNNSNYNENILEMFTEADWTWWNERLNEDDRQELSKLVVGQWLNIMDEARFYRITPLAYWDFTRIVDENDVKAIKTTAFIWSINNDKAMTEKEIERAMFRAALIYHCLFPKDDKEWG